MHSKIVHAPLARALALSFSLGFFAWSSVPALAEATIHAGDHLAVHVYNHDELSTQVITTSDGTVAIPLVGNLELAGLSELQASRRIEQALAPYLRYPAVGVRITEQAKSIFFSGAYNGVAEFQPGETLGAAVGNLTQKQATGDNVNIFHDASVDLRNVRIRRDGKDLAQVFNLEDFSRTGETGPALEPDDTIELSTKPVKVDVRGSIKTPGPVYVYPGDTLAQAVAQSGGYDETTSYSRIVLTRDGQTQQISSASAPMSAPAHDGDIVVLQPALHVDVLGTVQKPGNIVLKSGNTLFAAIYEAGGPAGHADMAHVKVVREGVATNYNLSKLVHGGDTSGNIMLADGDTVVVPKGGGIDGNTAVGAAGFAGSLRYLFYP